MDESITKVPGVGKALKGEFEKLGVSTLMDAVELLPRGYDDRRKERRMQDATAADPSVNCRITILSHETFPSPKMGMTLKVNAEDDDGERVTLLCFNRPFLKTQLKIDSSWYLNATVQKYKGAYSTSRFEIKKTKEECGIGKILPLYPLSGNLKQKNVRDATRFALEVLSPFDEILPEETKERYSLLSRTDAFKSVHWPKDEVEIENGRRTLAFTELLLMELSILREKKGKKAIKKSKPSSLEKKLISSLPFSLTPDQAAAIDEIREDLSSQASMYRLLQGDVGAGKTLVAWISALSIIEKGGQVAFMAPTELLARQHAEKASELLAPLGVRIAFVTGEVKGKGRNLLLKALSNGEVDLAIGTHALFSSDVKFKNLKYVIIDEQHRFGVGQREALMEKGEMPHVLMMTATPIPRTLAMTLFADMDTSVIHSMPQGRKPIKTHTVSSLNRDRMYEAVGVEFQRGHQAYFVYPRIDDEGESDLRDVTSMYSFLQTKYPGVPSALIHSKLEEEEKVRILKEFKEKKIQYLVSTSVVEVGIDIPDATCMVIEHAERFGLAALHQLRGRVGRSDLQSYCFLVFEPSLSEDGKERLKVMRETNDGFLIAEKDLEIRGPGEMAGNKQSGFLKLKFASITEDQDILEEARKEAERICSVDRGLIKGCNAGLRRALNEMKRD
ncbi:MAG: ATP-dependent DNA helicase RecG [Candidatus Ornithospirochaeta sp.]